MVLIDDGTGTGKRAKVTNTNELAVRATQHTEEHFVSLVDGQAYLTSISQVAAIPTLTFLTTEVGDVLVVENTGTSDLVITSILASANAAGGILTVFKNRTLGALTQNTVIIANNLNFGSAKISTTSVNVWDETNGNGIQGTSNGEIMRSFIVPAAGIEINTAGSVIVPQGTSITVNFNNITGGTIEFECGFRWYFDDDG